MNYPPPYPPCNHGWNPAGIKCQRCGQPMPTIPTPTNKKER